MVGTLEQIREEIFSWDRGRIFFIDDFASYESQWSVRFSLSELAKDGTILRLARGVYCYPRLSDGYTPRVLSPSEETIAEAIAEREHVRIIPYGDQAAYKLGLTGLRVSNLKYLTDGSPRVINLSKGRKIWFNHTSEVKMFGYRNPMMQNICMAVRALGKDMIGEEQKRKLREALSKVPEKEYQRDITIAPAWVQEIIDDIWNS